MKRRIELGILGSRSGRYALISETRRAGALPTGFLFLDADMGHDARLPMRPGKARGARANIADAAAAGAAR